MDIINENKELVSAEAAVEEWRDVSGYEGHYQVSSSGRIRSIKSNKILKDYPNHAGYRITTLHRDNIAKTVYTHTLVAETFLGQNVCCPTCGQRREINHKDRNRENNYSKNLEYTTRIENMKWVHEKTV